MSGYGKKLFYLALGQVLSAVGIVGMIQANIGLDPWNALHMGISNVTDVSFGAATIFVGIAAIAISAVLGEKFGVGTLVNVLIPGLLINLIQGWKLIPLMGGLWSGVAMMLLGQAVLAVGTYFYLAAEMGAGPRDALMVAVARKLRLPVGGCRSGIEVLAVLVGWLMGAKVGVGTVLSALTIGLFLQQGFALFRFDPKTARHETFADTARKLRGKAEKV